MSVGIWQGEELVLLPGDVRGGHIEAVLEL